MSRLSKPTATKLPSSLRSMLLMFCWKGIGPLASHFGTIDSALAEITPASMNTARVAKNEQMNCTFFLFMVLLDGLWRRPRTHIGGEVEEYYSNLFSRAPESAHLITDPVHSDRPGIFSFRHPCSAKRGWNSTPLPHLRCAF